jgi:hypothetical protein
MNCVSNPPRPLSFSFRLRISRVCSFRTERKLTVLITCTPQETALPLRPKVPRPALCLKPLHRPIPRRHSTAAPENHPSDVLPVREPCDDAAAASPGFHAASPSFRSETAFPKTSKNPDHKHSSEIQRSRSSFCTTPASLYLEPFSPNTPVPPIAIDPKYMYNRPVFLTMGLTLADLEPTSPFPNRRGKRSFGLLSNPLSGHRLRYF